MHLEEIGIYTHEYGKYYFQISADSIHQIMETSSPTIKSTLYEQIILPFSFDSDKMKAEVNVLSQRKFQYYDAIPLRAPAHEVDRSLPFPPPSEDYADGSWTEWMDTSYLSECPYIASIIDSFAQHTKVNLVRLLRLTPGAVVKEHTDPTLGLHVEKSMIRLTIPILLNDKVSFILNGKQVPMQAGECWYLDLTKPHQVINNGVEERINLTIDVIPNDWISSIIRSAAKAN